jgi:hypothetical protein
MSKTLKISLIAVVAVLILLIVLEYTNFNAKYRTPQTIEVKDVKLGADS